MKIIQRSQNAFVLRFDLGEEFLSAMKEFCEREFVDGGFFSGLGGAQEAMLAYYDLGAQEYRGETFRGSLEIASLTGNVAQKDGELAVHAHAVIGLEDKSAQAGHVQQLVIGGTCEVTLHVTDGPLTREFDSATGLWVLE